MTSMGKPGVSVSAEDRISTFESHCRLLLRAYPAAYRSERGEEIIGTLLETTPEGRGWPLPRDIRGLVAGGLRARAQLNRHNTTGANLRVAVFVGVAAYLAFAAAVILGGLGYTARSEEHTSELQSRRDLVCRLLLEKKKKTEEEECKLKKQKKNKT